MDPPRAISPINDMLVNGDEAKRGDFTQTKPTSQPDLKKLTTTTIAEEDAIPDEVPVKEVAGKFGLMHPSSFALEHEAAELLVDWAKNGCPVDTGEDWTKIQIEEAIQRGPHQSAFQDGAVEFLQQETEEKVAHNYAKVVRYGDIKSKLPKNFKISPVAMVPHKSKSFRCILDLSFKLKRQKGEGKWESVNSTTHKRAPQQAMGQLGQVVKRIVATMADFFDPNQPFCFTKLDIKDGFWRMAVSDEDAWNFCYVLPDSNQSPTKNIEDTLIVVPNSLQMGWTESPPCFCAGTETARDIMELILPAAASLPHHPLEDRMEPNKLPQATNKLNEEEKLPKADDDMSISSDENNDLPARKTYKTLFEVFVDDFMAITNNTDPKNLRDISRAMLHAIHAVFPPPEITGHSGEDPVSVKKIDNGDGKWSYLKEILGWMIDGKDYTISLPESKLKKLDALIRKIRKKKKIPLKLMQEVAGKLQHASFAMPGGWGLFSPIQVALQGSPKFVNMTEELSECLADWRTIVKHLTKNPTHVLQLVDGYPDFIGYTDACKKGAGGVWFGLTEDIGHVVWRVEFPPDIQEELCTRENPKGKITMNDLELAGVVLGWLVLEKLVPDLRFKHVGMNCDNSTAVSWTNKYRTAKSIPAARLLRLLSLRMHRRKVCPMLVISIAGEDNDMADKSSRSFGSKGNAFDDIHQSLTDFFNSNYPLPQNHSWKEFVIPSDLFSRVMSCVRGERSKMGSLLRLSGIDKNIGHIGVPTYDIGKGAPFWTMRPNSKQTLSSLPLLQGSGRVATATEIKLKFKPLQKRSRPSPRPLSWLANPLPSTGQTKNTRCLSSG